MAVVDERKILRDLSLFNFSLSCTQLTNLALLSSISQTDDVLNVIYHRNKNGR